MSQANDVATDDEEGEWRFAIDDVGPDGVVEETSPAAEPIEPESIELEHALFVTVGVVLSVSVLFTAL